MRVPFLSNQQFPVAVFLRKFEKLRARYKKAKLKEWGVYVRMKHYAVVLLVITICTLGTITLSYAWWAPADVNQDFKVDMDDVNLCRDAWKSNSSDLHWDSRCDVIESYGIIDIYDMVVIARHYGESDPVIPEFPSWALLPLLLFATLLMVLKPKRKKTS